MPRKEKTACAALRGRKCHCEPLEPRLVLSGSYSLSVVAQTAPGGLTGILQSASINDSGNVAFVASDSGGQGIYHYNGSGLVEVATDATFTYGRELQLNNNNQIAAARIRGATRSIQIWNPANPDNPTQVAQSTTTLPRSPELFAGLGDYASISNTGGVAFGALEDPPAGDDFWEVHLSGSSVTPADDSHRVASFATNVVFRPFTAEGGYTVMGTRQGSTRGVAVYDSMPIGGDDFIASTTTGPWSNLGLRPGISDDGDVVVFVGTHTTQGAGVYASHREGAEYTTPVKIAGVSGDGMLDPGETWNDANGNMTLDVGEDQGRFSSFSLDQRISVNRSYGYATSNLYRVAFVGTNTTAQEGLHTLDHDIEASLFPGLPHAFNFSNVTNVGSAIQSLAGTVQSVSVHDSINNNGQLAFHVGMSTGTQALVRAELPDTDGDGIYDAWETHGIDLNGDGTAELLLQDADSLQKNIYVEVDAMADFTPNQAALDDVVAAFAGAPSDGVILRYAVGPNSERSIPSSEFDPNFPKAFIDFQAVKAVHFGNPGDAPLVKTAKALVYRYAIFAKTYTYVDNQGNVIDRSSGLAEVGGDDFMVTLGHPSWNRGTRDEQAGTFMHELGHTLGLLEGGDDEVYFKPNYTSVMNYTWQTPNYRYAEHASSWSLDYSRVQLPDLDENSLDETLSNGIGGRPGKKVPIGPHPTFELIDEHGSVDWSAGDADGDGNAANDVGVVRDINFLHPSVAGSSPGELLRGHDDWSALRYNFRTNRASANGFIDTLDPNHFELTPEIHRPPGPAARADFDADNDVDGADFLAWQLGVGILNGATRANGDADGNGAVNGLDLAVWRGTFGEEASLSASLAFAAEENKASAISPHAAAALAAALDAHSANRDQRTLSVDAAFLRWAGALANATEYHVAVKRTLKKDLDLTPIDRLMRFNGPEVGLPNGNNHRVGLYELLPEIAAFEAAFHLLAEEMIANRA